MKENSIGKAILIGSIVIALSIVLGSFIVARSPHFEKTDALEWIDTRTGSTYTLKGSKQPGQPFYEVVPGPKSPGVYVEPLFKKQTSPYK